MTDMGIGTRRAECSIYNNVSMLALMLFCRMSLKIYSLHTNGTN